MFKKKTPFAESFLYEKIYNNDCKQILTLSEKISNFLGKKYLVYI